jgi:hypothetical protein
MAVDYTKYYYSTEKIKSLFKPSLSNYFDVYIDKQNFGNAKSDNIHFLAYDAVLPGTSFETAQVFGNRQGITQTYPTKRVYPPVDVSFYVDYDYEVIEFFEKWIGALCPNEGGKNSGNSNSFTKFQYPGTLGAALKSDIVITKFERNFRTSGQRLSPGVVANEPYNRIKYTLINAFPTNIISLPVSYEQSGLLRTTITFAYDLYRYERFTPKGDSSTDFGDGRSSIGAQPGSDTSSTQQANILGNTQEQLNALQAQSFAKTISNLSPSKQNELNAEYIKTLNK